MSPVNKTAIDKEVNVTFEDQQKINKFARYNMKTNDLKEELQEKEKELTNLKDASNEIILLDDDVNIPYLVGEVFVIGNQQDAENVIERETAKLESEVEKLKKSIEDYKSLMTDLKVELYARFGNNINLESDEKSN